MALYPTRTQVARLLRAAAIFLAFLIGSVTTVRSQHWQNVVQISTTEDDASTRLALDSNSDVVTVGTFEGDLTIDSITLSSLGMSSLYCAKFDHIGRVTWATVVGTCIGDSSSIEGRDIAVGPDGSVYIAGKLKGSGLFGDVTRTSVGYSDMLAIKLWPDGSLAWVRTAGGMGTGTFWQTTANGIAIDNKQFTYLIGSYNQNLDIDNIHLQSSNTNELAVLCLDSAGNARWGRSASGAGIHFGNALALGPDGRLFCVGSFFGSLYLQETTVDAGDPESKIFLLSLDTTGRVLYANRVGSGGYYGFANDISVTSSGELLLCGGYRADLDIGSDHYSYNNSYRYASLVVKYDHFGRVMWSATSGGDDQSSSANAIVPGPDGHVLVAGACSYTTIFGSDTLKRESGSSSYLAVLDRDGHYLHARRADGGSSAAHDVVCDRDGNIALLGDFRGSVSFGGTVLSSAGGSDVYIVRSTDMDLGVTLGGPQIGQANFYPNPADRNVHIQSSGFFILTDLLGRVRLRIDAPTNVDLSGLPSGRYLLNGQSLVIRH
ncbi:MAG: T9SS type A sorting domain-containing protein [Bacteroidetes bacterium]|nr:T9SS type A sorting domain-containing protein [Bacteroidota bacterium]